MTYKVELSAFQVGIHLSDCHDWWHPRNRSQKSFSCRFTVRFRGPTSATRRSNIHSGRPFFGQWRRKPWRAFIRRWTWSSRTEEICDLSALQPKFIWASEPPPKKANWPIIVLSNVVAARDIPISRKKLAMLLEALLHSPKIYKENPRISYQPQLLSRISDRSTLPILWALVGHVCFGAEVTCLNLWMHVQWEINVAYIEGKRLTFTFRWRSPWYFISTKSIQWEDRTEI